MTRTLLSEKLRRPTAVWWTVLVAVLFALAPTLTHALAWTGLAGAQRLEICSTQGPQALASAQAYAVDSPDGQESTTQQTHCPSCLHQADRCAPAPHLLTCVLKVTDGQQEMPDWQAFFHLDPPALWAPPRGPPSATGS
ncbi:hypothetical protein DIC66_19825 [Rhodoferax lacus]|uniref:DUF2946 domain-containing protein n=1 Tax=Rhodoferax lacus TaxID=2184758 RepID=A0A3E1R7J4_9BURK|nr:DUF2946 family protein [Rhodoferax lacus]RFO95161.1 hypothetical protein DIC66_19825 [Rhodoferax lacus]